MEKENEPIKLHAPLSLISPGRLKATVQQRRIENKELKLQINKLQAEIKKSSIPTSKSLSDDLKSIMSSVDKSKISPFMKNNKNVYKVHPPVYVIIPL